MNKTRAILLIFASLAVLILGTTVYNVSQFRFQECTNEEIDRIASPAGVNEAVVFIRNCGETGISAHISILETGTELPNDYGNALAVRGPLEAAFQQPTWANNDELKVVLITPEMVSQPDDEPRGVKVTLSR